MTTDQGSAANSAEPSIQQRVEAARTLARELREASDAVWDQIRKYEEEPRRYKAAFDAAELQEMLSELLTAMLFLIVKTNIAAGLDALGLLLKFERLFKEIQAGKEKPR